MFDPTLEFYLALPEYDWSVDDKYRVYGMKSGHPVKLFSMQHHFSSVNVFPDAKYTDFLNKNKVVIIIPLEFSDGTIFGFVYRAYYDNPAQKYYRIVLEGYDGFVYGLGSFSDFEINKPVIVTEGVTDCLVLQTVYRYSIASLTVSISKRTLYFIRAITNKVVLAFDNDPAGIKATEYYRKLFIEHGVSVDIIRPVLKDFGDHFHNLQLVNIIVNNSKFFNNGDSKSNNSMQAVNFNK